MKTPQALLLLFFACFFAFPALAQKSPIKFGVVPMDDMKMTLYDKDSSASALVLADYGEAYILITNLTATLTFERHTRIKILKSNGKKWADVGIPLYHSGSGEEKVTSLKAATYNLENGSIVETKMLKDGVFKEKFNRNINLQKFTMPNVKVGSVIEYTYKISSVFLTNFPNWKFQHHIPVRHSEYWAIIPDFFIFEKYTQGYVPIDVYEVKDIHGLQYNEKGHHWVGKNIPAFKQEPFMTCEDDYVSKVNFALSHINFPNQPVQEVMGSWAKLNALLLEDEDFGKVITRSGFLKDQVEQLTAGVTDNEKKVRIIHSYIKENIQWDKTSDMFADNLKKVVENKKGTAADINLLLASMLDKAGLSVDMILLSTRDHGFIRRSYPMTKQFNYVICAVNLNGETLLLDATEKYLPMGILPERCLNGAGLIISNTRHGWINIAAKAKSKTIVSTDLTIGDAGELKGKVKFIRDGYDACEMRNEYFLKGEKDYLKDFLNTKTWQVQKTEFENIKEDNQTVKEIHDVIIEDHVSIAGGVMYVSPFLLNQKKENPFKADIREYPVDFGANIEEMVLTKITIPEGYVVDELPQSKIFVLPGNAAKYLFNIIQTGNVVSFTSNLQINKSLFVQDEYPNLREFYNHVVAKQAEQIVLKKK